MKPPIPHDPFDELIAAALHGELTPEERAQFNTRLQNDPAARVAYQEAQLMHDLLEKTHKDAQPDDAFEQRMVSGVRRKIQTKEHRETAWESVLVLWRMMKDFPKRIRVVEAVVVLGIIAILFGAALGPITRGTKQARQSAFMQTERREKLAMAGSAGEPAMGDAAPGSVAVPPATPDSTGLSQNQLMDTAGKTTVTMGAATTTVASGGGTLTLSGANSYTGGTTITSGKLIVADATSKTDQDSLREETQKQAVKAINAAQTKISVLTPTFAITAPTAKTPQTPDASVPATPPPPAESTTPDAGRKLIRNAELELEVKSFQAAIDQITALTKTAGGYVDTSNSQKGGNGKLQGTIVVKVLPQNLDDFLLKLRDLGKVENQSVKADDVTKDYFDTQARLENSKKMEVQLQDLLKRENGKVSDLLQVERELGRVRGEIEQMQGQLKLYDFQVQYATVTMQLREKDLNQAAAYLLKEQDEFALFATDVEGTFQKARQSAESFKAQILQANLNHNSGSDVSADLVVMVAPDQIEPFLADVRTMGRIANFTRQTQRVAKDGGDSDQPADQTLTEKDKVQVHLSIRSDDESRKQVALTVVTPAVDTALDQAKAAALANAGVEILSSSLNKTPQGQSTAQLSVRVPGKEYSVMIDAFNALGRTASLSIQRNDDSGPGASGDDAPVIISLSLTDNDTPLQQTVMSVLTTGVDAQAQQIKKDALTVGVTVTASSFARQPDGIETAQMTFRLPMAKYPAFVESLKKLGKVESLTVRREDRPDQNRTDDSAPVEINLSLHNQGDIVADNNGLWATLRQTFGDGVGALLGSVRVIGVLIAFLAPWVITLALLAWVGRRIYLWRKK